MTWAPGLGGGAWRRRVAPRDETRVEVSSRVAFCMCDRISALISLTLGTQTLLSPRHCSRFTCPSAIKTATPPPHSARG